MHISDHQSGECSFDGSTPWRKKKKDDDRVGKNYDELDDRKID